MEDYPLVRNGKLQYMKIHVEVDQSIINDLEKSKHALAHQVKAEQFVIVNVEKDGYSIPQTASVYDDENQANTACRIHNDWLGLSIEDRTQIMLASLKSGL